MASIISFTNTTICRSDERRKRLPKRPRPFRGTGRRVGRRLCADAADEPGGLRGLPHRVAGTWYGAVARHSSPGRRRDSPVLGGGPDLAPGAANRLETSNL